MNTCLNCKKETRTKFCSSSCSASYNNKRRAPRSLASRAKTSASVKLNGYRHPKGSNGKSNEYCKFSYCVICKTIIKNKIRKTCSKNCYHQNLSAKAKTRKTHPLNSKKIMYNGVYLGSSYELSLAKSLDENSIIWCRPSPLKWIDKNNNERRYFPDFYLPDYDIYLDPKNDFLINNKNPETGIKDSDKIFFAAVQNNVVILILNKNELTWESVHKKWSEWRDSNSHA